MKRIIGIDFTDGVIHHLRQRGFSCLDPEPQKHGFQAFFFPLADASSAYNGFEIQVVDDEVEYLQYQKLKHFFPFIKTIESVSPVKAVVHANTVLRLDRIISDLSKLDRDLSMYLGLRKNFPLSALHLECMDLKKFCEVAKPDHMFHFEGQSTALIHLGPSCFDLVVTEEKQAAKS